MSKLDKALKITGGDRNHIIDLADVYQEEMKALKIILAPAIEAARARGVIRKNQSDGHQHYNIPDVWRTDKALLAAGEILGLIEESEKK